MLSTSKGFSDEPRRGDGRLCRADPERDGAVQRGQRDRPRRKMIDLHREYSRSLAEMATDLLGLEDALRTTVDRFQREPGCVR